MNLSEMAIVMKMVLPPIEGGNVIIDIESDLKMNGPPHEGLSLLECPVASFAQHRFIADTSTEMIVLNATETEEKKTLLAESVSFRSI